MLRTDSPVCFEGFILDSADAQLVGTNGPIHIGRKAFRVLEALIAQPGRLLTKEDLFETVWDGTAVSESALTTVIKELRRALGDESKSPRFIQSVYGRGYRFIAPVTMGKGADAARSPIVLPVRHSGRPAPSRRAMLGLGAVGIVAGSAGLGLFRVLRPAIPAEVSALIDQSCHLMDQNTAEGHNQAIGLLRRAVEIAPYYADGWGLLGVVYAVPVPYRERAEGLMLRARARAAAERALELDDGNAMGELALALERPNIGYWLERDRHLDRALADRPDDDRVLTFVAATLHVNGRPSAAIPLYERIRQRPLRPFPYSNFIRALWSAGRIEEADRALDDATALYPTQGNIWYDRYNIYLFGGRADAALELAKNPEGRPSEIDDRSLAQLVAMAHAVRDPGSVETKRTIVALTGEARKASATAQAAIRLTSAIGALDTAFALADAYFFSRGFAIPEFALPGSATSLEHRRTRFLFEPSAAVMRADPRFEPLVAAIGLDAYWRASGKRPDFRVERSART